MAPLNIVSTVPSGSVGRPYAASLAVSGGTPPYSFAVTGSALPDGLELSTNGDISGVPTAEGTTSISVRVQDSSNPPVTQDVPIDIVVAPGHPRSHPLDHVSTWLALLAVTLPIIGFVLIFAYAFATPGLHTTYFSVGLLTALAALLGGVLMGFLFGIPKAVSTGELRHATANTRSAFTLSPNLAEVSDWLTKLLLGAGLVELTKLGGPLAKLIGSVARGLQSPAETSATGSSKVAAGAILFGYVILGFLEGYVITTVWYQKKLNELG